MGIPKPRASNAHGHPIIHDTESFDTHQLTCHGRPCDVLGCEGHHPWQLTLIVDPCRQKEPRRKTAFIMSKTRPWAPRIAPSKWEKVMITISSWAILHQKKQIASKISPEMPSQVMVHVRTDLDVIPLRLASSETGRVDLPNFAKAWSKAEAKSHFLLDFIL